MLAAGVLIALMPAGCAKAPVPQSDPGTHTGTAVLPPSGSQPPGGPTTSISLPAAASTPTGTLWAAGPNPCALATDKDVRNVTHFDVTGAERSGTTATGAPAKVCLFANRAASVAGGSATITVLPPGSNFDLDRANVNDVREIAGLGVSAFTGYFPKTPTGGKGTNTAIVNMGNGGFSIGAFVYQDLGPDDVANLARIAAANWPPGT